MKLTAATAASIAAASITFAIMPAGPLLAAGPDHVDITWMSIANIPVSYTHLTLPTNREV